MVSCAGLNTPRVICPRGRGSQPLGGYTEDAEGSSWVPVSDAPGLWAQTDRNDACARKTNAPELGVAEKDEEGSVMCCLSNEYLCSMMPFDCTES